MTISKGLAVKGLAGAGAVAATATVLGLALGGESSSVNWEKIKSTKASLGIGDCVISETNNVGESCTIDAAKLAEINFDGREDKPLTVEGEGEVIVTAEETEDRENLKFVFKTENKITVKKESTPLIIFGRGMDLEFRVRRDEKDESKLLLERAWTADSLAKRSGMERCDANGCTLGEKINLSDWDGRSEDIKVIDKSKKIKFEENQGGYNQGLKFIVKDEISLDGGKKLTRDSTYEIKGEKINGIKKWFLSKKTPSLREEKIRSLGLPSKCKLPENEGETKSCGNLNKNTLGTINFEGKSGGNNINLNGGTVSLEITKVNDKNIFPEGYRFTFKTSKDVNIPATPNAISLMANTNPEFKIKIKENNTWSLEKAWDIKKLSEKVNLYCSPARKDCSFWKDKEINIFKDTNNYLIAGKAGSTGSKMVNFEENQKGYNQGFKFISGQDIVLTDNGATKRGSVGKIEKNNNGNVTYEIKEQDVEGGKRWFFSEKRRGK